MVNPEDDLHIGDHIEVRWGVGTIIGEIADVYGSGPARRVVVKIPVHGPGDEILDHSTVALPLEFVERVLA